MAKITTSTGVVNLALRAIGKERITDLDTDTTIRGVRLQDLYEHTVEKLMRRNDWSFAGKVASLTEDTAEPAAGWENQFPIPTDWVRTITVSPTDIDMGAKAPACMPYQMHIIEPAVSPDDAGRKIWVNSSVCYLWYIYSQLDAADPQYWPADFTEAVAQELAYSMIKAGVKSTMSAKEQRIEARRALAIAMSADGIEDWAPQRPEGSWVAERWT